jgi:phytoene synthase
MSASVLDTEHACRRCEQITRREAANFYYGIRLLPRTKRYAISAVYAFARRVDDIGDGDMGREQQLAALAAEREMLSRLADEDVGAGEDPVQVALLYGRREFDLPLDALEQLIGGVELDVLGARYETFDELVGYCRRVAGTVGRLCVAIFADGATNGNGTASLADDLGVAMQLTNIVRDVREDRQLGRVYLPAEDLRRFQCSDLEAARPESSAALIRFEAARAAEWFDRGLLVTESLDPRSASCVLAMTGIYRTVLERIMDDPNRVLRERISLSPWEKAWIAARSLAAVRPKRVAT